MSNYHLSFWNVENLFDVIDSPRRSDKLQRAIGGELQGWTEPVLARKLAQLASVVRQLGGGGGPDILGVCEVENRHVLERLCEVLEPLGRRYDIVHADTEDGRGIDVAFIYDRDRFEAEEVFSHYFIKRVATRDIVQVNFRTTSGRLLVLIGNHWPSRLGGRYESEPYRLLAGETIAYFHERIRQIHGSRVAVVAMGDFNDEPFDRSMVEYALCERQRDKVLRSNSARFLNLMWPVIGSEIGTHYHQNSAGVLDQVLVSAGMLRDDGGLRVLEDSVEINRFAGMVGAGLYPVPVRFGRGNTPNPDGFSDHFPVSVQVVEA
jgi:endonuclease/exonuclease/phosphatase family metal-dependent hydrolase